MRAKLTQSDIDIITHLYPRFLAEEIAQHVSVGIGPKIIQAYIDEHLSDAKTEESDAKDERIAPAKKHEPKGFAVHREVDSVMSDAIKVHEVRPQTEGQKQRAKEFIHAPYDD